MMLTTALDRETPTAFLEESRSLGRLAWLRRVREWARRHLEP